MGSCCRRNGVNVYRKGGINRMAPVHARKVKG